MASEKLFNAGFHIRSKTLIIAFQAGKSQANASPDNGFMQEEMPKALEPLELSSELLDQSSKLIQKDGKSSSGRSILIDACRS